MVTPEAQSPASGVGGDIQKDKTIISQRPVAAPEEFYRQMPLADLAAMLEGRVLDHFAVQQMIGGGGMGAVFRGLDQRLNREVAIKVMPSARRDPEALRRFRLEAQAAARLDHPNIARVFYVGESEQWNYIVFEFIDGVNIRDLVEMQGPLSVDDAVFFTRQVAEALQHAAERGVVHRDIKPSNILVTASGTAKLVDMGLARDTSSEKSTGDQTASGITLGTFDYISPEQARNPRDADVRSDLYSLGCSLFFMLTGHPPFPDGTALQKLLNHGSVPPPDPRGWRDDLSDQLYEILMKLMAKRPSDRYQRPVELVNDLQVLAELENLPRSQSPSTLTLSSTIAQPTILEASAPWLIAILCLLGSTFWLQTQSSSRFFSMPNINFPSVESKPGISSAKSDQSSSNASGGSSTNAALESTRPGSETKKDPIQPELNQLDTSQLPTDPSVSLQQVASESVESSSLQIAVQPVPQATAPASSQDQDTALPSQSLPSSGHSNDSSFSSLIYPPTLSAPSPERSVATSDSAVSPVVTSSLPVVKPTVIVVSTIQPTDVAAQDWESSLYRAVRRINTQSIPAVIEVRGSIWLDRPLVLENHPEVTLRSSSEELAKIEVARGLWSGGSSESGAIQVVNSKLVLQGIRMHVALTETAAAPRTILRASGNSSIEFQRCEVTVRNDQPELIHLMSVGGQADHSFLKNKSADAAATVVNLTLQECFIRGACGLIRINQTNSLDRESIQVSISDSLAALGGRILDLTAATGNVGTERIVRFFCDRSTFASAAGFGRLEHQGTGLPMVGFSRTSQACVFWSRPGIPHLTVVGSSVTPQSHPDLLLLQGLNNAYDQATNRLCEVIQSELRTLDLSFSDGQLQNWFVERGNERQVRWVTPITNSYDFADTGLPAYQLMPSHFVPGFRYANRQ